jgi:hypothetical protein
MPLTEQQVRHLIQNDLLGKFQTERNRLDIIDRWVRWDHDKPHQPRNSTTEYKELSGRAQTPWLSLVVTSVVQGLIVDGYRRTDSEDNSAAWDIWQANGMDRVQVSIHRAAVTYGSSYATVLPGQTFTGQNMPVIRGVSPREMMAFYTDPANDDWPVYALRVNTMLDGNTRLRLYDAESIYDLTTTMNGPTMVVQTHGIGVCPVVRYVNLIDLEGRTDGEVEPFIPTAGRIDQTTFDRLIVQRFSSWVVRTIAGMSLTETIDSTGETPQAAKMRLRVEDMLVAEDPDTKFGSLPASDLAGFIAAREADIRDLAAVSQTPAHEMLGQMANLSAEALAAARASATAKISERKITLGESHEQMLRLAAHVNGDAAGAVDYNAQVRWRDTEIRSLAQAADALGKLSQMLSVPVEMLWEKIPGWTDTDVERAKVLVQQDGGIAALLRELVTSSQATPTPPAALPPAPAA